MIIILASNPLQQVNELLLKRTMKVDNSVQIYIRKEKYIHTMAKLFLSIYIGNKVNNCGIVLS